MLFRPSPSRPSLLSPVLPVLSSLRLTRRPSALLLFLFLLTCTYLFVTTLFNLSLASLSHPNYLWSTPRSDGFNNQLISIYESLACAIHLNRTLVLPHFFENVRKDTSARGPFPFEDYFDLGPLTTSDFRPVVTTASILRRHIGRRANFKANRVCHRGVIYYTGRVARHGFPVLKHYQSQVFKGLTLFHVPSSPTIWSRLFFFGDLSTLQCIDDSLCPSDIYEHKQLGVYSNYTQHGQGFDIRRSPFFHSFRRRFHPSFAVRKLAHHWIEQMSTSPYMFNAIHVRRGDYDEKCKSTPELCEQFGRDAIFQSTETLHRTVRDFTRSHLPLFVSTTSPQECKRMMARMNNNPVTKTWYMQDLIIPTEFEWMRDRTDVLSLASQIVASYAKEFVGNRFSSYTSEINNMRYVRNSNTTLKFF